MPEFDYSKDIAPLRGNYFTNPALTDRERSSLRGRFATEVAPLMDIHDRMDSAAARRKQEDLQYQRSLFALKSEQQERRQEREDLQKLPAVNALLDSAFADPKATVSSKARAITDITTKYAAEVSRNPALAQTLSAYSGRLDFEDAYSQREEEKARVAADKKKASTFSRASALAGAQVAPLEIAKVFGADGEVDQDELNFLNDYKTGSQAKQDQAAAQRAYEVSAGQQQAILKARDGNIEAFNKYLEGIESAEAEASKEVGAYAPAGDDSDIDGKKAPAAQRPFSFSRADHRKVVNGLAGVYGLKRAELEALPDQELFDLALQRKYAVGSPTGPSDVQRRFGN